jgi:hypothetical protein
MLHRPLIWPFTVRDCDIAARWSVLAELNGDSTVRESRIERTISLPEDQLTGMLALMAVSRWLTGGIEAFRYARACAYEEPSGTHATPVHGSNFCCKSSLIRGRQPLWQYNLPVRPKETHAGWDYGLILIAPPIQPFLIPGCPTFALIMGCAPLTLFPDTVARGGTFKGAYTLQVPQLDACQPMHGMQHASDELIDALEAALGIKPQDRCAVVRPRWAHWAARAAPRPATLPPDTFSSSLSLQGVTAHAMTQAILTGGTP